MEYIENKKIYKYYGHGALSNIKTVHTTMFKFEKLQNIQLTEYEKEEVTNPYLWRLFLSLTWGWHSVSRRQCHDLKNKTPILVITYDQ